jgi:hypothetical protein
MSDGGRAPKSARLADYLPERAGAFLAGTLVREPGFVRRVYARASTTVSVTIADRGQATVGLDDWLKMSEGYVQASLDVPPTTATGFYTCTGPRDAGRCDLHIHSRAGYHVEVFGGGGASRADLDEVVRGLPLGLLFADRGTLAESHLASGATPGQG